jgi:hypothetical protein
MHSAQIHSAQIHSACEAARSLELTEFPDAERTISEKSISCRLERCGAHSQLEAEVRINKPVRRRSLRLSVILALTRLVRPSCSQSD